MNQKKVQYNNFLKVAGICLVIMLNIGYLLFSYNQAYELTLSQNKVLLLTEKGEISTAFNKYNQYLSLIESRLSHSLHKKETISRILMEKIEPAMGTTFPMIINLEFIPTSNPSIVYTRLGITLANGYTKASKAQQEITHLEKGIFRITKPLYDERKKTFGTLTVA